MYIKRHQAKLNLLVFQLEKNAEPIQSFNNFNKI